MHFIGLSLSWLFILLYHLWNIKDGFATLIASLVAFLAAVFAWKSVQDQIKLQTTLEAERLAHEKAAVRLAFFSEMYAYVTPLVIVLSNLNKRLNTYGPFLENQYVFFGEPHVFMALRDKIGLIDTDITCTSIVSFYANLFQSNEIKEQILVHKAPLQFQIVVDTVRLMAIHLADALERLEPEKGKMVPKSIDITSLFFADGTCFMEAMPQPKTLGDILRKLSGK